MIQRTPEGEKQAKILSKNGWKEWGWYWIKVGWEADAARKCLTIEKAFEQMQRETLLANGWQTYYNENNWVKTEWFKMDSHVNADRAGMDINEAFNSLSRQEFPEVTGPARKDFEDG